MSNGVHPLNPEVTIIEPNKPSSRSSDEAEAIQQSSRSNIDSVQFTPSPEVISIRSPSADEGPLADVEPNFPQTYAEWRAFCCRLDGDLATVLITGIVMFGIFFASFIIGFAYEKEGPVDYVKIFSIMTGSPILLAVCSCVLYLFVLRIRRYRKMRRRVGAPRRYYDPPSVSSVPATPAAPSAAETKTVEEVELSGTYSRIESYN